jgi:Ca2+-transporting ATPase
MPPEDRGVTATPVYSAILPAPAGTPADSYARDAADVATAPAVAPGPGLSADEAARRLARDGPNARPAEKPRPGTRRFLDEHTSSVQLPTPAVQT